ncbi:MAG TPA: integration host factor subunit alpha [Acidobacteria bacterium]|nr:integration host factor subunit alpha [Acidobacteriota bacterium]
MASKKNLPGTGASAGARTGVRPGRTKADLVDVVYDRHGGLTKNEAAEIVDAIFQTVKVSLGSGRTVKIKNFGTFEITDRPGRVGVNPVSGEKIFIRAHKGLSFKPARRLKGDDGHLMRRSGRAGERDE